MGKWIAAQVMRHKKKVITSLVVALAVGVLHLDPTTAQIVGAAVGEAVTSE